MLFRSLSVDEVEKPNSISLYPNPTSGKIHVLFSEKQNVSVVIYNILGHQVFSTESKELDISFLTDGIYLDRKSVV